MIKTVVFIVLTIIVTALSTMLILNNTSTRESGSRSVFTIVDAELAVKERIAQMNADMFAQMSAFCNAVIADSYFSLKLYGENDRSAQEVVAFAGKYMTTMGFSVLKIADSDFSIVSSGHFPASSGNEIKNQLNSYQNSPAVGNETIVDRTVLTYQIKKEFRISDYKLYALGGVQINDSFFKRLTPWNKVGVIMKRGNEFEGMDVKTVSELKDGKIIINDKEYFATMIPLASTDKAMEASLIVTLEK
jgi:hypothetical protein